MSGAEAESPPNGEAKQTPEQDTKDDDEWGKFYSLPPKWKKDESSSHNKSGLTDENIGHRLASLLRYHLDEDHGITTDDQGWVTIDDIIAHADEVGLSGCTTEDLIRVAETNEHSSRGKRFDSDGAGKIKAKYRHPPKDRRGYDRYDSRGRRGRQRGGGYNGWHSNGWDDGGWKDYGGWQDYGEETWKEWKKPGFSPAPDDSIVKESSWAEASGKATENEAAESSTAASASKAPCDWEQWFTPDTMEMYYYNTKTEEVFFPNDAADLEEKGWCRYEETEGERKGKIYWWHEETERSFYEEDTAADEA